MPPKQKLIVVGVKPVTPGETNKVAKWIAQGAPEVPASPTFAGTDKDPLVHHKDRQFWAFQTPHRPEAPKVQHSDRVRNPIDAFPRQTRIEAAIFLSGGRSLYSHSQGVLRLDGNAAGACRGEGISGRQRFRSLRKADR